MIRLKYKSGPIEIEAEIREGREPEDGPSFVKRPSPFDQDVQALTDLILALKQFNKRPTARNTPPNSDLLEWGHEADPADGWADDEGDPIQEDAPDRPSGPRSVRGKDGS